MKSWLDRQCPQHDKYECADHLLDRHRDGTIGILIKDGGTSMILINFCPWCGVSLPRKAEG
jgi:hypothetical protein